MCKRINNNNKSVWVCVLVFFVSEMASVSPTPA